MYNKIYYQEKKSVIRKLDEIYAQKKLLSNYAFSLYLFVDKLHTVCQQDKVTDLFFLARDGYFLKELYDEFAAKVGCCNIKTHYMYVSRMSIVNSTLERLEDEKFDWTIHYRVFSIYQLLKVLQFTDEEIDEISFGEDLFSEHQDLIHSLTFFALKENKVFKEIYEFKRLENKKNLELYLQKCGIYSSKNPAIVDLGWFGTIQDYLYKVWKGGVLRGYYLGCFDNKVGNLCVKNGLLFNRDSVNNSIRFKHYNFEYICIANHGTTNYYDNEGVPVMIDDGDVELFELYYKKIQSDIKDKLIDIMKVVYGKKLLFDFEKYVFSRHAKMLLIFTSSEKEILFKNRVKKFTAMDRERRKNLKYWLSLFKTFLLLLYAKIYNDWHI